MIPPRDRTPAVPGRGRLSCATPSAGHPSRVVPHVVKGGARNRVGTLGVFVAIGAYVAAVCSASPDDSLGAHRNDYSVGVYLLWFGSGVPFLVVHGSAGQRPFWLRA